MSSVQFDGSHTPAKRGGEAVACQARKKTKTRNHNDLFNIEFFFTKMLADLKASKIEINGLFFNTDAGFDTEGFRPLNFLFAQ